jgi:hypothetical protein
MEDAAKAYQLAQELITNQKAQQEKRVKPAAGILDCQETVLFEST